MPSLRIQNLLADEGPSMQLELVAGKAGLGRRISAPRIQKPGLALTGYTAYVHPERLQILDVYGHFISALVTGELFAVRVLAAAVRTVHDMVHYRDPETGAHIDRMARYARLIARHLGAAGLHAIDDRRTRRKELPIVSPYPFSKGSAMKRP